MVPVLGCVGLSVCECGEEKSKEGKQHTPPLVISLWILGGVEAI